MWCTGFMKFGCSRSVMKLPHHKINWIYRIIFIKMAQPEGICDSLGCKVRLAEKTGCLKFSKHPGCNHW
jgi:hypothetical protein